MGLELVVDPVWGWAWVCFVGAPSGCVSALAKPLAEWAHWELPGWQRTPWWTDAGSDVVQYLPKPVNTYTIYNYPSTLL